MIEAHTLLESAAPRADGLYESNLFLTFSELAERFIRVLGSADGGRSTSDDDAIALDRFLLAAGLNQILEDHLHRDVLSSRKVSKYAAAIPVAGPAAAVMVRAAGSTCVRLRSKLRRERRLQAKQRDLAAIIARLAHRVATAASGLPAPTEDDADTQAAAAVLADWKAFPSALRRTVQRVPNCFRSFDQQPDDCRRLAAQVAERWPQRDRRLLIVGLRTSGGYLSPLVACFLRSLGYESVDLVTLRPGQPFAPYEVELVRRIAAAGGLGLVVDDPPKTGSQVAAAAAELATHGLNDAVLLLQLSDANGSVPETLRDLQTVVLPPTAWAIHERLKPEALERSLVELLVGRTLTVDGADVRVARVTVTDVSLLPPKRGHVGAVVHARVVDATSGGERSLPVYVKGVGLGYFGRHAQVAAVALGPSVPPVFGVRDGLMFRLWLPEEARVTPERLRTEGEALAGTIARYVVARHQTLPLREDFSLRLQRLDPVWEHIANMLGEAFGGAHQFVRSLTFSAAKQLASVAQPSVTDGRTAPWEWYGAPGGRLRKTDFHQRGSSNVGFRSCDPIFDLADAAAAVEATGDPSFGNLLKRDYEELTSAHVDNERWLLYRLVHHFGAYQTALRAAARDPARGQSAFHSALRAERTMADIHRRYFEERYFADLSPLREGPFCAIDIDGVLETRWLAFPAIAPAGAAALRSLALHGYRAVLVTGRSLEEVRSRCRAFRLAGGVAEYGAVIVNTLRGDEQSLLTDDDVAALAVLRDTLTAVDGVYVDPAYRYSVRAHRLDSRGQRRGLTNEAIAAAIARAGVEGRVRPVRGGLQTDFVATSVDKGRGLLALMDDLGNRGGAWPVALAVGDTASDLPMFSIAQRSVAPANAAPELRGRVEIGRRPYGAGLRDAVNAEVHNGRRCQQCRPRPRSGHSAALLQAALHALDGGSLGKLQQAAALAFTLLSGV